jgi:hypothetical protein
MGPRSGMAANQLGSAGGRVNRNGRYGEARRPKAPIAKEITNSGRNIRKTNTNAISE